MTGIAISKTKTKVPSEHANFFSGYLDETCSNITQTLMDNKYNLKLVDKLRPSDFTDEGILPFRFVDDNLEVSLDRSFELKLNAKNELYLVNILGGIKLAAFNAGVSLSEITNHLKHFNFEEAGNSKNYRAGVDIWGKTLPGKAIYSTSMSGDALEYVGSSIKNLRTSIFGSQDVTLPINRAVAEILTEKFQSEVFIFPEIKEDASISFEDVVSDEQLMNQIVIEVEQTQDITPPAEAISDNPLLDKKEIIIERVEDVSPLAKTTSSIDSLLGQEKIIIERVEDKASEAVKTISEKEILIESVGVHGLNVSPLMVLGSLGVAVGLGVLMMMCARNNHANGQVVAHQAVGFALNAALSPVVTIGRSSEKYKPYKDSEVHFDGVDSPVQFYDDFREDMMGYTPARVIHSPQTRNELLRTAQKRANEAREANNDYAAEVTINNAVEKFVTELDNDDNADWFREHKKEFQITLQEYLYGNVKEQHHDYIYKSLKESYHLAVEKADYDVAFTGKRGQDLALSSVMKNLKMNTKFYTGFGQDKLLGDLKSVAADKGYILYLVMFMAIPLTQAVEVEDFYGNNKVLENFDYLEDINNISNKEDNEEIETTEELEAPALNFVEPEGFWVNMMSDLEGFASYAAASGMANILLMQLLYNPYTSSVVSGLSDVSLYGLKHDITELYHDAILDFVNSESNTHHLRGSIYYNEGND